MSHRPISFICNSTSSSSTIIGAAIAAAVASCVETQRRPYSSFHVDNTDPCQTSSLHGSRRALNILKATYPRRGLLLALSNTVNSWLELLTVNPCTSSEHCNVQAHTASGWMGRRGLYIGWASACARQDGEKRRRRSASPWRMAAQANFPWRHKQTNLHKKLYS